MNVDKTQAAAHVEPEVMTVKEVAALLRLSPKTLYRMIEEKKAPPGVFRIGYKLRWRRGPLIAWMSGQESSPRRWRKP